MAVKFATVPGISTQSTNPHYIGIVQHDSTMTKKETYAHLCDKLKFSEANIKAAFLGFVKALKVNAKKGNDALMDGIARFKIYAKGPCMGSTGPWVKGVNYLSVNALEADGLKNALEGVIPENVTEGLSPAISTVLDTVTSIYDVVKGTDVISIGGVNLGPDTTKTDEKVYIAFDDGTVLPMTIQSSSLTLVTAKLATAPTKTGTAKLCIATRCGMGSEYGIKTASRIISIVA